MTWRLACDAASAPPAMMTVRSPCATREASGANPLRQAADETDRSGRTECRPVVVIHLVAQTRIADLIEAEELIETQRAAVRHQQPVKGHGESRLAERLNGSRLAENACARGNQDVLAAVGVHRVRDQAVDGGGSAAVEPVGQDRVDDRSLEQRMQRTRGADWLRVAPACARCACRRSQVPGGAAPAVGCSAAARRRAAGARPRRSRALPRQRSRQARARVVATAPRRRQSPTAATGCPGAQSPGVG